MDGNLPLSDQLKQAINVYDYVGQYVALDNAGGDIVPSTTINTRAWG